MKFKKIISLGLLLAGAISICGCTTSNNNSASKTVVKSNEVTKSNTNNNDKPKETSTSSVPSNVSTSTISSSTNSSITSSDVVINKYNVTFDFDNGDNNKIEEIEEGSKVLEPTEPKKDGYTFKEWQLNGVKFDFNTPITSTIVLKAVYISNPSTDVEYENVGFGGSYTNWNTLFVNSTRENNKRPYMGANDDDEITSNGFTFLGKSLLDSGILNTNASVIKINLPNDNSKINMSATWASTSNKGKIRVYKDGVMIYESDKEYSKSDSVVTLALENLDAGVYEIKAEKTDVGDKFELAGLKVSTIYYNRVVEYVNVNYKTNTTDVIASTKIKKGTKLESLPTVMKSGYRFEGWYTTSDFKEDSLFNINNEINEEITLYAKWYELQATDLATISFVLNVDGYTIKSIQIEKGQSITSMPTLDIEGYRFNGWYTDQSFQNEFVQSTTISDDKILYAEYIKVYTVTFKDKDGNDIKTITVDEDTLINETISKPYVEGYKFDGWKLNGNTFDITTEKINSNLVLFASYVVDTNPTEKISILSAEGLTEAAYVTFNKYEDATNYNVYLDNKKLTEKDYYLTYDKTTVRADLFGLTKGNHNVVVEPVVEGSAIEAARSNKDISVEAYDRSGFAHFNYTAGVGAYNDDGTLKENAIVLYVTDENKNTISITHRGITVTGIGNILNSAGQESTEEGHEGQCKRVSNKNTYWGKANSNQGIIKMLAEDNIPLVVRIVGCVSSSGLYKTGAFAASNAPLIDGLTYYNSWDCGGTYGSDGDQGHMARIQSGKDITIEGVGSTGVVDGWGFHFMCQSSNPTLGKSFELRNISFINTPEDAVGMEGVQDSGVISASVERCWVHNNNFYCPNITTPIDNDKSQGDGSCDFKRGQYFTCSYNYFEKCHKTCLVGSSDSSLQFNLTYHHNYWYMCEARGPLARQANIHMYNNLFFAQSSYALNPRADAYIFSESNLFYACKNPMTITKGAIKSYNDMFASVINDCDCTKVDDKMQKVTNNCKYGNIDYSSFETNSNQSYIPTNDYFIQTDHTEIRKTIEAKCGVSKDRVVSADDVNLSDISILGLLNLKPTINEFTNNTTKTFDPTKDGKITETVYAFKINDYAEITLSSNGILVNEAGIFILEGNGSAVLTPGTYFIQSTEFQPEKTGQVFKFKECIINSITLKPYDSSEFMAKLLVEFNAAYDLLPTTVLYNDECYNAIKNAMNKYSVLNSEAKAAIVTEYQDVISKYNQFKALGIEYVEGEINKILSPVTVANSDLVINARNAYNQFNNKVQDATISNLSKLISAEAEMQALAVDIFVSQVNALPDPITYSAACENAINNAYVAYDALDETQLTETSVVNAYTKLQAAKAKYESLEKIALVNSAISSANDLNSYEDAYNLYNQLTAEEKTSINEVSYTNMLIAYDIALINSLPDSITLKDGELITKAMNIYNSLSTESKAGVTNYSKLEAAYASYNQLAAETVKWSYDGQFTTDLITASGSAGNTSYTYDGVTYSKGLKLQSSAGKITVTLTSARKITIYASKGNSVMIDGVEYKITAGSGTTIELAEGVHVIEKGDGEGLVHAIIIQ